MESSTMDRENSDSKLHGRLAGKNAIITGASRGIGAGIARKFVDNGANILLNYNNSPEKGEELVRSLNKSANGGSAFGFRADVSKVDEIRSMVQSAEKELGRIDILVNNAGIIIRKNFLSLSEEEYDRVMAVNVKSTFFCCQEVIPLMLKQGKGNIVNISSISGLAHPSSIILTDYVASKAAVIGITRSLAVNFGPQIRINTVAPGAIDTDMLSLPEAQLNRIADEAFLKRRGTPEDIANACVFLASDDSDFITGEILTVGGGRGMR
jgi:3-oxoacyl-[acyl-carrier protein] reductase